MLNTLRENQQSQAARDEAKAAVTGATTEEKLAAADSRRKTYASAVADMARNASTLKDGYLSNWQNHMNNYYENKIGINDKLAGIYNNNAQQWANTASNAYQNVASSAGMVFGEIYGNKATTTPKT